MLAHMNRVTSAYERVMRPVDAFFRHLENWLIILGVAAIVIVSAGFDLAYWLGVTLAAWKYLLG